MIEELISERARRPVTVIFSSHLIGDLERLCSQFAVLADRKIAVMEDVAWFRQLVRAILESEEEQLAGLALPAAALVERAVRVSAPLCWSAPESSASRVSCPRVCA